MAVGDDNVIEHDVVVIGSTLENGFAKKLQAKLDTALKGVTGNVKLVADATGFRASATKALAAYAAGHEAPTFKVRLVADATGFAASARTALAKVKSPTFKVKVVADSGSATRDIEKVGVAAGRAGQAAVKKTGEQAKRQSNMIFKEIEDSSLKLAETINKKINKSLGDAFVLKREKSPNTAAARAKVEKEVATADRAGASPSGFSLLGVAGQAARDRRDARQLQAAQNYVLGLREKYIEEQLKLVRNGADKIEKDQQSADDKQLSMQMAAIGRRFDMQRNAARQADAAVQADIANNVKRQRANESFVDFNERVRKTLAEIEQGRANDEITIREETNRRVNAIGKSGLGLRTALLTAEDKVDRQSASNQSRVAREVEQAAARRAAAWKKTTGGQQLIDFGGEGIRPMNLLYASVAALTPALFAMAASAVQASTSVAALGAAGIGAALGIGGLVIAFKGLSNLLALRKTVKAQQDTAAANAVTNAHDELVARNNLIDAQKAELKAEKDLHDARKEAARDLVDLRQKVADLQNQQKEDTVSLAEAEANRAKVYRNYFSTALDRARADQDVNNAKQKQSDTTLDLKQGKEDLADGVKKGVEKSDKVTKAKDALRLARERAAEAKATPAVGTKASSAAGQLQAQLAKASPALRDLYNYLDKNSDKFTKLGNQIQQAFLPGFTQFLTEVNTKPKGGGKTTLEFFTDQSAQLGGIVSKYVGLAGAMSKLPWFRKDFGTIQENNVQSLDILGGAAMKMVKPIVKIFAAASPLLVRFSKGIDKFATWFDKVIDKADKDGSLAKWFRDAGDQASKWFDIGKDVLTLLGNLFKGALPSGTSLVDRFEKFTRSLADWSGSPKGQEQIAKFFDFFKTLPYGDIFKFFAQAIAMFGAIQVLKYAKSGPLALLFSSIGTLATQHPGVVGDALGSINTAIFGVLKAMADHPAATSALLTILAAKKTAKTFGLDLKIPGINNLPGKIKDILTSKFKVLNKFVGGGANTATMTVHAGVVNVYGAAGATPGGLLPTAEKGGAAAFLTSVAAPIALAVGAAVLAGFTILKGYEAGKDGEGFWSGVKAYQKDPSPANFAKLLGNVSPLGMLGRYVGGEDRKQDNANPSKPYINNQPTKYTKDEAKAYVALNSAIGNNRSLYASADKKTLDANTTLQNYIAARRTSVSVAATQYRSTHTPAQSQKYLADQNQQSRNTLSTVLQQSGMSKKAADDYATSVYGVARQTYAVDQRSQNAATSVRTLADMVKDAAGQASKASGAMQILDARTGDVVTTLAGVVGNHKIQISADGYDDTLKQLQQLYSYQQVLYNPTYSNSSGGADTVSSQTPVKPGSKTGQTNPNRNNPLGIPTFRAEGGPIRGAGTATSDSIPAWLSHGEYVMPAKTVQHYGMHTMEAMRRNAIPAFAKGGQAIPMKVAVKNIPMPSLADIANYYAPSGDGGAVSGDEDVARIAEATARNMGATEKQLIALFEAGLVESGLHNLTRAVDHDSLGFLQQRPSQGWGTAAQITNVAYATRKFIEAAKRMDGPGIPAGELAARVQRPAAKYRGRYAKREADAAAVINRLAPYLTGYAPATGQAGTGPTKASLVAFGRSLQARGYTVSENPAFGPVGKHTDGSKHYQGRAIDVNHGAGTSALEQSYLAKIIPEAHRLGFHTIFMEPDHYNHAHIDFNQGGPVQVPTRKYDTGGTLPPGYTLAFNGTGRNETIRTHKQEQALGGPVRLHRADIALLAAHIAGAASPTVHMDGRKVAEITNAYTYLPAGV